MHIKEKETPTEKYYRMGVIDQEVKKTVPIILLSIIILIAIVIFYKSSDIMDTLNTGTGNPYECMDCKKYGVACSEHKKFNAKEALNNKIEKFGYNYIPNSTDDKLLEQMYGAGNHWNLNCDFCNEHNLECESCKHDRLVIQERIDKLYKNVTFTAKMCNKCQDLGYANCSACRNMVISDIINNWNNKSSEDIEGLYESQKNQNK